MHLIRTSLVLSRNTSLHQLSDQEYLSHQVPPWRRLLHRRTHIRSRHIPNIKCYCRTNCILKIWYTPLENQYVCQDLYWCSWFVQIQRIYRSSPLLMLLRVRTLQKVSILLQLQWSVSIKYTSITWGYKSVVMCKVVDFQYPLLFVIK